MLHWLLERGGLLIALAMLLSFDILIGHGATGGTA
jgi:hypothetical protein